MNLTFVGSLLIAASIGVASGTIGTFVILERMALAGDALSHVALPGIALALAYSVDPFWGVLVFLLGAAGIVWYLKEKTNLPADALIGILFTSSLAIGILTIPNQEILESLFGQFPTLSPLALVIITAIAMAITCFVFLRAKEFLFSILSPELSKVYKVSQQHSLVLLLTFAVVVSLGIKLVGTLLMGALTIIPALAARNLARSMKSYLIIAGILGGFISTAGITIAHYFNFLPGPTIVLFGVCCFLVSLLFRK